MQKYKRRFWKSRKRKMRLKNNREIQWNIKVIFNFLKLVFKAVLNKKAGVYWRNKEKEAVFLPLVWREGGEALKINFVKLIKKRH